MESWTFLLVGGVGAVGAASVVGTAAALVHLRRTGTMPGGEPVQPGAVRRLWLRIAVGAVVAVVAAAELASRGLLSGAT